MLGFATACERPAAAQPGQELLPEQSAAKAKALLQQVITVLGGRAYLDVRDFECDGRIAQFESSGNLAGSIPFHDQWLLPDKDRLEYISKGMNTILGTLIGLDGGPFIMHGGVVITVYAGAQGWMLDKAGVSNQPEDLVKSFAEQVKSGMNNMLRSRMNEDGMEFRYAGTDLVDLKEVEWIEISDRDHRVLRMAVDKFTHLPMRWVVTRRDPETREQTESVTSYAQFLPIDGVKTPLNVSRTQNGRQVSQIYLKDCKYNVNLSPQLFTRASLEQLSPKVAKKGYEKATDKK
jgi:hypothetical protein